jgi:hypothetical protein
MATNVVRALLFTSVLGASSTGCSVLQDNVVDRALSQINVSSAQDGNDHAQRAAQYAIADYGKLSDESMGVGRELAEIYGIMGYKSVLATPESYPDLLNDVIELTNTANILFNKDHPLPPIVVTNNILMENSGYAMVKPAAQDSADFEGVLIIHESLLSHHDLKGVLSHELRHLHDPFDLRNLSNEKFESWKGGCDEHEQDKVSYLISRNNTGFSTGFVSSILNGDLSDVAGTKCVDAVKVAMEETLKATIESEARADAYTALLGNGEKMIHYLKEIGRHLVIDESTHGGLSERVSNIEKIITISEKNGHNERLNMVDRVERNHSNKDDFQR